MRNAHQSHMKIYLVGNPNVGKTSLLNVLCDTRQKTGNYSGVTVQALQFYFSENITITDIPGIYSVFPSSEDEKISVSLLSQLDNDSKIIFLMNALNIKKGMLLYSQIRELGVPTLVVVNQIDEAANRGISNNYSNLEEWCGVPVFAVSSKTLEGIENLKHAILKDEFRITKKHVESNKKTHFFLSTQELENFPNNKIPENLTYFLQTILTPNVRISPLVLNKIKLQDSLRRQADIEEELRNGLTISTHTVPVHSQYGDNIDRIFMHPIWGYAVFFTVLLLLFQSVFYLAQFPVSWIENAFGWITENLSSLLPDGPLQSLLLKGIIPGIEGVAVFVPQIALLLFFLKILEDTGYMARIIFLTDRLVRPFGLNGKSIIPLVSGAACAIPAILSARTIDNKKERLITILVTPFITCSARLPVYTILIGLIIPSTTYFGISLQALALLCMYLLGVFTAFLAAFILHKVIPKGGNSYLVMELPVYKRPILSKILLELAVKVKDFLFGAGKIIFAVSILIWVFSYFGPKNTNLAYGKEFLGMQTNVALKDSYLGRAGHAIEPALAPMGFNWKIGVGILTSFAAREVFVGTLSTLYSLEDGNTQGLMHQMKLDSFPDGRPVFSFATGVSLLLFYAFAMQCISTIAVVYRETKSAKLALFQAFGMTVLACISSLLAFQILR